VWGVGAKTKPTNAMPKIKKRAKTKLKQSAAATTTTQISKQQKKRE